ncbi:MAG: hypothetical protein ABI772_11980 [Bacteroidota bacterium]
MEVILLPFVLMAFLAPPLMSGLFARSMGHSFWKWFAIGCVLPFIANVILFFKEPIRPDNIKENL